MEAQRKQAAMAAAGVPQLVLLPRDPKIAYVYWEWPDDEPGPDAGELTLLVEGPRGSRRVVESFEIRTRRGGRFIEFSRPDAIHCCKMQWGDLVVESDEVLAPRHESGDGAPEFVRVAVTERGLEVEPTEHEHPVHGRFPASSRYFPGSQRPVRPPQSKS